MLVRRILFLSLLPALLMAALLAGMAGAALVPFFLANVLLAPFVEESLSRGYAFGCLQKQ